MRRARTSIRVLQVVLWVLAAGLAFAQEPPVEERLKKLGDDVIVRQLAPGVWMHITFRDTEDGKRQSANGLLITTGEMSLLIDTGWNDSQVRRLLDWAADTLGQPVEHVIVTHAHVDRTGGLRAVVERPIIVHGHAGTAAALHVQGRPRLQWSFEFEEQLDMGGEAVHLFYPGPGHSPDNIVIWLPRRKILFVGCLIRGGAATQLGFTGDAEMGQWPRSVRRVIERYRDAEILIPGHGRPGGVELLSHTMELLEKARRGQRRPRRTITGPKPPSP